MERLLKQADDRGVALIMTVAALAIVMSLSAAAVTVVLANVQDARRANARTAARAMAEAGADEFFSRLIRNPEMFAGGLSQTAGSDPALAPHWAELDNGSPQPCAGAYFGVCFQVDIHVIHQPGNRYADAVTVQVTAATLCTHGVTDLAACVTETVHQRLSQRQYFDYLYFDQLETLDPLLYPTAASRDDAAKHCPVRAPERPATCIPVPFLGPRSGSGGDVVSGPIHTNDASFTDCLSPTLQPPLDRSGWPGTRLVTTDATSLEATGASVFIPATGASCAGAAPHETPPGTVTEKPDAAYYSFAVDVSQLATIARADSYTGPVTITLSGGTSPGTGTYSAAPGVVAPAGLSAPQHAWPGTGVIYVAGDAYVSGVACDPVSIAATGSVFVQADLTYADQSSCPDAATGLEADDSVVVLPSPLPGGPPVNGSSDRTIEAAILALGKHSCIAAAGLVTPPGVTCAATDSAALRGGSFFLQGWDTTILRPGAAPHLLHFLGAIATIWRGAIGGFDPASGRLLSGWAKDFSFDRRLRTAQPPYFLSPVGAGWARTDLAQVGTG